MHTEKDDKNVLDISEPQTTVEDAHTPSLGTCSSTRDNSDVCELVRIGLPVVVVPPHGQGACGLVLHEDVAFAVAVPVGKMNTDTRAGDAEEVSWSDLPVWR